jgi:hypothetical protein
MEARGVCMRAYNDYVELINKSDKKPMDMDEYYYL